MKKNILAFLFGDSQIESEIDETRDAIEHIFEEVEDAEPLKAKKTPLASALKTLGVALGDNGLEMDPEGFSICFDNEDGYRHACRVLMEPDGMEKLAELGWVATRMGDKAMSGEVEPEYRVRFIDITTPEPENKTDWPAPNPQLIADIIKKGREFATTPFERDPNNPVTDIKAKGEKKAGVGKEKDGSDPEGKPKGSNKAEANDLVDRMLNPVNEGGHKAGCTCGFCKNKGRGFGKKKEEPETPEEEPETTEESKKPEADEVPYVDKTGKQKRVPWIRKPKAQEKTESAPPTFDDLVERSSGLAMRKGRPKNPPKTKPVASKPKAGGAPGKAFKTPRK
jgi:hypothetical protein